MFGKTRELKLKMLHWIYSKAVRAMIAYAATMWWSTTKFKTSTARIIGAKMMTPTAATEALLELPVQHSNLKLRPDQESMDSIVLDNGSPNLKGMVCLHVLKHGVGAQPMKGTDRITPRYVYNKSLIVMTEGKWKVGSCTIETGN